MPDKDVPPVVVAPIVEDITAIKAELDALRKEKDDWGKSKDKTLHDKVIDDNKEKDKNRSDSKTLEAALTFNLLSNEFIKNNESVLPKGISDIFKAAEKETYDSAVDKANAIKDGIIQSFFSQQLNVDMLTHSQKSDLADFQKLTKNGREAKAQDLYKNLFEPALESLKRVKKAEELYKANQGFGNNTDVDQAYKDKLSKMADRKFFRGKANA